VPLDQFPSCVEVTVLTPPRPELLTPNRHAPHLHTTFGFDSRLLHHTED
jgi:hypothetical protein